MGSMGRVPCVGHNLVHPGRLCGGGGSSACVGGGGEPRRGLRWGRHVAEAVTNAAVLGGLQAFLWRRLDRAVWEEEGLSVGCAGIRGDGIMMVGVNVGACGRTGEEGAKRTRGDGQKVGALTEGMSRDCDGCLYMVD